MDQIDDTASLDLSGKISKSKGKKISKRKTNEAFPNPTAGQVEVEVKATSVSLQLQVQKEIPKLRRITRSSTRKASVIKSKVPETVDLETTGHSPMVDNTPNAQNLPATTGSLEYSLALVKSSYATGKDQSTPKWLETSIEKKRSIVPISMRINDLVSRCLGKTPKVKRVRTKTRINFDKKLGR